MKPKYSVAIVSLAIMSLLLLLAGTPAQAVVDMFLKVEGIDGESTEANHKAWIDVLAFSFGATQSASTHTGGGGTTGKVNIEDLYISKYLDKATPTLLLRTSDGKHIPKVQFEIWRPGDKGGFLYGMELTDVIISSVHQGGSGVEDRITEGVSLNFGKIKWIYQNYNPDGSKSGQIITGWNLQLNEPQ